MFSAPQVFRLQNPIQWELYTTQRAQIEKERNITFRSDENESINRIVPLTLKTMKQQFKNDTRFDTETLKSWANEVFLFHGTKVSRCVYRALQDSAILSLFGYCMQLSYFSF